MKSQIKVFARLKPCFSKYGSIECELGSAGKKKEELRILAPKYLKYGQGQTGLRDYTSFTFTGAFDAEASQDEVFERAAKKVVLNCMDGFNGTIFAYGQTGSGKTYSMSGADSWQLRGIIPRVLTFVYDEIDRRSDHMEYNTFISYMEIYNENAYDLLDRNHLDLPLEKWNKIVMLQDDDNNIHLKNLSVHNCKNEQQGIDLLMMGNFIRKVSSTPMNMCSSRSHCIFTITLESKNLETNEVLVAKLNLVDLAGSERLSKNQLDGTQATETKHINLSLTYLEQVIVALKNNKGKKTKFVPYRNSLMTTILKDSLGGNCRTTLIACLSSDVENVDETVSTCRFAQRCGQLENTVKQNVMTDLPTQVKFLQMENKKLVQEIEKLKKDPVRMAPENVSNNIKIAPQNYYDDSQGIEPEEVTPELIKKLKPKIEDYLNEKVEFLECRNLVEAQICFEVIKQLYNSKMKEYIKELSHISEKLRYYDQILAKKIGISNMNLNSEENDYDEEEYYE